MKKPTRITTTKREIEKAVGQLLDARFAAMEARIAELFKENATELEHARKLLAIAKEGASATEASNATLRKMFRELAGLKKRAGGERPRQVA